MPNILKLLARTVVKTRFAGILLVLALTVVAFSQSVAAPKHRAIFQMSEPEGDEWSALLAHIQNARTAFANGGIEIEVVFFGPGLNMLRKTNKYGAGMESHANQGVRFAACRNSMRDRNITVEDMFPFVTTVDSGVAELIRKQEGGWAYFK